MMVNVSQIQVDVRYVVFHRDGYQARLYDGLYFRTSQPAWINMSYPPVNNAVIYVPVDPITAMTVLGCTPEELGFSEAEQALLNLLKKGS
jgi:hypothetical protein